MPSNRGWPFAADFTPQRQAANTRTSAIRIIHVWLYWRVVRCRFVSRQRQKCSPGAVGSVASAWNSKELTMSREEALKIFDLHKLSDTLRCKIKPLTFTLHIYFSVILLGGTTTALPLLIVKYSDSTFGPPQLLLGRVTL